MVNRKGAVEPVKASDALTGCAGNVSITLENRGELRRLAATKNNRLNSSVSFFKPLLSSLMKAPRWSPARGFCMVSKA
jgi:hypothetical protein